MLLQSGMIILVSIIPFQGCKRYSFLFLQITTVKVSNVSLGATEQDIKEFFSFSGDIECVEMQRLVVLGISSGFFDWF